MEKDINSMNKQEAIDALTSLGVSFDKTAKVEELRSILHANSGSGDMVAAIGEPVMATNARYVKNVTNGRVFAATPELLRLPEIIAITEAEYNAAIAG